MNTKHTPGDWRYVPVEKFPFGFKVMAGDVEILSQDAACWASGQKYRHENMAAAGFAPTKRAEAVAGLAEQEANGKLLAAASDLLEALEALREFVDQGSIAGVYFDEHPGYSPAMNKAIAAIAKATK
jgi:hypothetical protein